MADNTQAYIQLAGALVPIVNSLAVVVEQLVHVVDGLKGDDAAITQHIEELKPLVSAMVAKVIAYRPAPYEEGPGSPVGGEPSA